MYVKEEGLLTADGEEDRQEHEAVEGPEEYHAEVHAEVEDTEDLRPRESQHEDPPELGQGDARENLQYNNVRICDEIKTANVDS